MAGPPRLAAVAAACLLGFTVAQAEDATLSLKEDAPHTGSIIRKDVAWSKTLPLNRKYSELTEEQKASFHAMYEPIAPGDEPPFPRDGLRPMVVAIQKAQEKLLARGKLRFIVLVGADGKGKKVEAYGDCDSREMTQFAASVVMLTPYKPVVCKGAPCVMEFPFNLSLKVN